MAFNQDTVNTAWLIFDIAGQWSLLALILTYCFINAMRQWSNPFLVNLLITTFIASIPPSLLGYTGNRSRVSPPSPTLCFIQASLVDGVAPMFGVAQLALLFDVWLELRAFIKKKSRLSREMFAFYTLLFLPYFTMWVWIFGSFVASYQSKAEHDPLLAYCQNDSKASNAVRKYVGIFVLEASKMVYHSTDGLALAILIGTQKCVWLGWMSVFRPDEYHRRIIRVEFEDDDSKVILP
ncbi:hypothetical protein M422DRAFT_245040 [Sphaerobolus stellatus SS14]|nr:hypothetical protein M422DRAFT_245040 [Sphaerobolus stellatus SS14]